MPLTENDTKGIHVIHNNTFYYIENGISSASPSLERLRKILVTRNILKLGHDDKGKYDIFTLKEAKRRKIDIVVIAGSPMIEKLLQEDKKNPSSLW